MLTPYDWQEGIGNRAQFIEGRLASGAPVLAVSLEEGILVFTYRKQARKIYEIYDRLVFAGLGQQSDIESLRVSALEFASREGYNRSEEDVTIQRVATAMSGAIKTAFGDFTSAPVVARCLFAEVNETPEKDLYYAIDFDGDYTMHRQSAGISGSDEATFPEPLKGIAPSTSVEDALARLTDIWNQAVPEEDRPADMKPEAVLLERSDARENRFRLMYPEEF